MVAPDAAVVTLDARCAGAAALSADEALELAARPEEVVLSRAVVVEGPRSDLPARQHLVVDVADGVVALPVRQDVAAAVPEVAGVAAVGVSRPMALQVHRAAAAARDLDARVGASELVAVELVVGRVLPVAVGVVDHPALAAAAADALHRAVDRVDAEALPAVRRRDKVAVGDLVGGIEEDRVAFAAASAAGDRRAARDRGDGGVIGVVAVPVLAADLDLSGDPDRTGRGEDEGIVAERLDHDAVRDVDVREGEDAADDGEDRRVGRRAVEQREGLLRRVEHDHLRVARRRRRRREAAEHAVALEREVRLKEPRSAQVPVGR